MMTSHAFLFAGLIVGLSIAVPIGPMGILCIQRTLASGMRVGVSTGLGAATIHVLYGGLILLGLDRLAPLMAGGGRVLGCAGGLFLLWSAARTLTRRRGLAGRAVAAEASVLTAYGSAVAFNTTNPMSPILIVALLTPIVSVSAPAPSQAALLLAGIFLASATWWICLSGTIAFLRARLSPGVLVMVNQAAGIMLTIYGAVALAHSFGLHGF